MLDEQQVPAGLEHPSYLREGCFCIQDRTHRPRGHDRVIAAPVQWDRLRWKPVKKETVLPVSPPSAPDTIPISRCRRFQADDLCHRGTVEGQVEARSDADLQHPAFGSPATRWR